MKIYKEKIIIGVEDLKRKVVLIKNYRSEEELQTGQVAIMEAVPGCIAVSINSFDTLNRFRKNKGFKELVLEETMVVDMSEFFKLKDLAESENVPPKKVRKTKKK